MPDVLFWSFKRTKSEHFYTCKGESVWMGMLPMALPTTSGTNSAVVGIFFTPCSGHSDDGYDVTGGYRISLLSEQGRQIRARAENDLLYPIAQRILFQDERLNYERR